MPQKLVRENTFFVFDKTEAARLEVDQGERFLVETYDARRGRLKTKDQIMSTAPDWKAVVPTVNPCTGPISVKGVKSGDAVKVSIHRIGVDPRGFIMLKTDMGICKHMVEETEAVFADVVDGRVEFDCGLTIPLRPHIGTLGTTPDQKTIATAFAGIHGGNMDCRQLDAGSVLYLPVFVDGAMLGVGDVHASQGNGELMGSAVEVCAEVEISVEKADGLKLDGPVVCNGSTVMAIASAPDLQDAVRLASVNMVELLTRYGGLSTKAALCMLSTLCDGGICQGADENLFSVAFVSVDKKYLPKFAF